jgi:hypothetical protein
MGVSNSSGEFRYRSRITASSGWTSLRSNVQ